MPAVNPNEKALTVPEQDNFTPVPLGKTLTESSLQMADRIGTIAFQSGFSGNPSREATVFKILTGYELGLPMMASLKYVYAIKTQAGVTMTIAPKGVLALMYNSGLVESFEITDIVDDNENPIGCTVSGNRVGNKPYEVTFMLDDAARAKLVKPNGAWEKYPANMCRWRALGFFLDVVVPDLTLGLMRTTDITDQVNEEGVPDSSVIVEVKGQDPAPPPATPPHAPPEPKIPDLASIMQAYSPEQILAANDGKMPSPNDDMSKLLEKLEQE